MKVFVNDEITEIAQGSNLEDLSKSLGILDNKGWAFALNESIVPKKEMVDRELFENDRILLIEATQGG